MRRPAVAGAPGFVRVIGGQWRGRRLPVPAVEAVRPSSDRVRETLFNWLSPRLAGARCLDLFAGTGVLGFEAVSRGAHGVTFLDSDPRVVQHLEAMRDLLAAGHTRILGYDAAAWLAATQPCAHDIVFVDPPFAANLAGQILDLLARGWVAPTGVVYVEAATAPVLGPAWKLLRQGHTRQVTYSLLAPASTGERGEGES